MKRFLSIVLVGLMLALPVWGTVAYDNNKSLARNQVDALIAAANALVLQLNDVLFVDGDRADTYVEDGSIAHPYKTIAAAKAASASGDVLVVAPGAYSETVTLTSGTTLFGWNVTGTTLTGNYILLNGGGLTVNTTDVVVNEDSADINFRVESNDVSDALVVDAGINAIKHGTWDTYTYIPVTAASYSLSSTGRAGMISVNASGASTLHFMSSLLTSPGAGGVWTIKLLDGDDVVIDTEGAETIDGAATFTMDGNMEATTFFTDGANFFVVGGYLE